MELVDETHLADDVNGFKKIYEGNVKEEKNENHIVISALMAFPISI